MERNEIMCAQNTDAILNAQIKTAIQKFLHDYDEILRKHNNAERNYLEKSIVVYSVLVDLRTRLFSLLRDALIESKEYMMKKEAILQTIEVINSLSSGQRKYYGLLLKNYVSLPNYYSTREIIAKNHLSLRQRSTIQRLFADTTNASPKWQRGNKIIHKILKIDSKPNGRKLVNVYMPIGFPAAFANVAFCNKVAARDILLDSKFMAKDYDNVKKLISNLQELLDRLKELNNSFNLRLQDVKKIVNPEPALQSLANDAKQKLASARFLGTVNQLQTLVSLLEKGLEERAVFDQLCVEISALLEKLDAPKFILNLDEKFYEWEITTTLYNNLETLTRAVIRNLAVFDSCLFILELLKAQVRSRSTYDSEPEWEYDGIEPYLQLKQSQESKLENGIISEEVYKTRLKIIKDAIKSHIRNKASINL